MSEGLYDEDGVEGPFERRMNRAMREDSQRRAWERKKAPKAHALIERCWKVLDNLLDEEKRGEINGLLIALGPIARSGRDIDHETWRGFEADAVEMIERAEKA